MSDRPFAGVFVAGTDTGVGKTVVSAALVARLRSSSIVRYWKPIQTGIEHDDDRAVVQSLSGCTAREIFSAGIRLPRPLSPHLSARLDGSSIRLDDLVTLASAQPDGEFWIVEGAGGVLVPLNDRALMIDLMAALAVPAVVVARSSLGTINHTLLTLEALRSRGLSVAGVVMVGESNADNRQAIEQFGRVAVIGELPMLDPLNAESVGAAGVNWSVDLLDPALEPRASNLEPRSPGDRR